jgi:hypothetical protein
MNLIDSSKTGFCNHDAINNTVLSENMTQTRDFQFKKRKKSPTSQAIQLIANIIEGLNRTKIALTQSLINL